MIQWGNTALLYVEYIAVFNSLAHCVSIATRDVVASRQPYSTVLYTVGACRFAHPGGIFVREFVYALVAMWRRGLFLTRERTLGCTTDSADACFGGIIQGEVKHVSNRSWDFYGSGVLYAQIGIWMQAER